MDLTEQLPPWVPVRREGAVFFIDRDLVTRAAFGAWLRAGNREAPPTFSAEGPAHEPALGVSLEDAEAYAADHGMRLPTEDEWALAAAGAGASVGLSDAGVRGLCRVWEWTATRMKTGNVVRGGRYRDRPEVAPATSHRSWEDAGSPDIGFRCVRDTEPTLVERRP